MFNAGSSGGLVSGDDGSATYESAELAIMNTILAPAAGGLLTFYIRKHITGEKKNIRMDFQALTNGILAGLVCITASCDVVDPWAAVVTGFIGSLTYCFACKAMIKLQIDDPLEAFQVHGCCGVMGCVTLAFFKKDVGILYGGKTEVDADGNKTIAGGELLGVQLLGCLCIIAWSGGISAIFFFISHKMHSLRLSEMDELLGGDLHYFGPVEFTGKLNEYDLAGNLEDMMMKSAKNLKEDEAMNNALEMVSKK